MKLLGILGTQEIIILLYAIFPLTFIIFIPVLTYKAGLKRGRRDGGLLDPQKRNG